MNFASYARHPFWQAVAILVLAFAVIEWGSPALPGSGLVPASVVLQYMATVLVGVLIYVSDSEERWALFKAPIAAALVQPRLRPVRVAGLGLLPPFVGFVTPGQVRAPVEAPPTLPPLHPAPPPGLTFRGKT